MKRSKIIIDYLISKVRLDSILNKKSLILEEDLNSLEIEFEINEELLNNENITNLLEQDNLKLIPIGYNKIGPYLQLISFNLKTSRVYVNMILLSEVKI